MKVLVVSEGARDIGDASERQGAVRVLVRRLLEDAIGRSLAPDEMHSLPLARVNARTISASGYALKVRETIEHAAISGYRAVAVVVDRDRTDGRIRLRELEAGRQLAHEAGSELASNTALGVAIETVEAWLLADEKALNAALQPEVAISKQPDPESLDGRPRTERHPKTIFESLAAKRTNSVEPYDAVASVVDLDVVGKRCPKGFAPFVAEVQSKCVEA